MSSTGYYEGPAQHSKGHGQTNSAAPHPYWQSVYPQHVESLPSMSSLLTRPDHLDTMVRAPPTYPPPPYVATAPHHNHIASHPLYLSEMNPSAPVHHIYQPSHDHAHRSNHWTEPMLIPTRSGDRRDSSGTSSSTPPQRRQAKKISQRRGDSKAAHSDSTRSSRVEYTRTRATDHVENVHTLVGGKVKEELLPPSTTPTMVKSQVVTPTTGYTVGDKITTSNSVNYKMFVRQPPIAARACGFGERDRRVIDPPPILQLAVEDSTGRTIDTNTHLREVNLVVHCTLWNPATDEDASAMTGSTDKRQQRRLMGTLVSSPFVGKDEFNIEGCFFTFPDLSVRTPGTYSLRFSVVVIDPARMLPGGKAFIRTVVKSEPFNVYNAKDFGGMRASTALTKRLKHQGCLISVKKGNTKNKNANSRVEEEEEEEDDYDDDDDENDYQGPTKSGPPSKQHKA